MYDITEIFKVKTLQLDNINTYIVMTNSIFK